MQILLTDSICAECEKVLPKFSLGEIYNTELVICAECEQAEEIAWNDFQKMLSSETENI